MEVEDIPSKADALRTGLLKRSPDPKHTLNAAEINAIVAALVALRAGTSGSSFTGTTTNATPTVIGTLTLPDNTVAIARGRVLFFVDASDPVVLGTAAAHWQVGVQGGAAAVGDPFAAGQDSPPSLSGAVGELVASGADIHVRVTGIAATTIKWKFVLELAEMDLATGE